MISEKVFNIALIGCGRLVEVSHLPTILKSRRAEIVALVDKYIDNANKLKNKYTINCETVTDLSLVKQRVDGVLIATPNNSHFPIARDCLEKGIPVFIEKPMCIKSSEASQLCDLANKKELFISVGYWSRHVDSNMLMKELLDSKYFGKILSYEFEFGTPGGWAPVSGYIIDKELSGGGVLSLSGTHIIDRFIYWFDVPYSFDYEDDSHGGVEANCKARFYHKNDMGEFTGSIFLSKTVLLKNRLVIYFEKATCEITEGGDRAFKVYPKQNEDIQYDISRRLEKNKSLKNPFQAQFDNFLDCLEGQSKPTVDGEFAAKSVKLIEEMYNNRKQAPEPWILRI